MITCDCVVDSKKKPEISYPTQFEHTIHVGFDPVTSEFTVSRLSYSFKEEFCVLVERPSSKIDLSDQLSIPGFPLSASIDCVQNDVNFSRDHEWPLAQNNYQYIRLSFKILQYFYFSVCL